MKTPKPKRRDAGTCYRLARKFKGRVGYFDPSHFPVKWGPEKCGSVWTHRPFTNEREGEFVVEYRLIRLPTKAPKKRAR